MFNGQTPDIVVLDSAGGIKAVGRWLAARTGEGFVPHEMGVFVRSAAELDRACAAVEIAGLPFRVQHGTAVVLRCLHAGLGSFAGDERRPGFRIFG